MAGILSFAYTMTDAPLYPLQDGLRARLGEAVLAKYYGLYSGHEQLNPPLDLQA